MHGTTVFGADGKARSALLLQLLLLLVTCVPCDAQVPDEPVAEDVLDALEAPDLFDPPAIQEVLIDGTPIDETRDEPPVVDGTSFVTAIDEPDYAPVGQTYVVRSFLLEWARPIAGLPDLRKELGIDPITLATRDGVILAPEEGGTVLPLDEWLIAERDGVEGPVTFDQPFTRGAIDAICDAIENESGDSLGQRLHVGPAARDIEPGTGRDLRRAERDLTLLISWEGPVDEPTLPISRFSVAYVEGEADHPELPDPIDLLDEATVDLVDTPEGFFSWHPDLPRRTYRLGELDAAERRPYSFGAVQAILESVRDTLLDGGLMAVNVAPAPGQIEAGPTDVRGGSSLVMSVTVGLVREVRTLAVGDRIPKDPPTARVDNPNHKWIWENSPIRPDAGTWDKPRNLLQRDVLDDYIFRLSRHPGRRIDVAVAPGGESDDPFGVALDYIVAENSPLTVYAQVSNTGTRQTERLRRRAGIFHNQLTGRDDILSVEAITADLDDNTAVIGSYEFPISEDRRIRARVFGDYSQFLASEVGLASERFLGKTWSVGGELAWNFWQSRQHFADLVVGARYSDIEVENAFVFVDGAQDFLFPYAGVRYRSHDETTTTNISALLEFQLAGITDVDSDEANALGRLFPDDDWLIFKWDANHSFYLDPLIFGDAWDDPTTPGSSTLAHEMALRFRGQYAFDNRLIPQLEHVMGGLYSVRGYPESVAVGDSALVATAEYRFHLPRALGVAEPKEGFLGMSQPFRTVPEFPYGVADWDLVLRGFFDIGRTVNSDPFSFEKDQTLIGAGVGVQFIFKRNLDVRMDWGFALEDIDGVVNSGSNRVHFVATILF